MKSLTEYIIESLRITLDAKYTDFDDIKNYDWKTSNLFYVCCDDVNVIDTIYDYIELVGDEITYNKACNLLKTGECICGINLGAKLVYLVQRHLDLARNDRELYQQMHIGLHPKNHDITINFIQSLEKRYIVIAKNTPTVFTMKNVSKERGPRYFKIPQNVWDEFINFYRGKISKN